MVSAAILVCAAVVGLTALACVGQAAFFRRNAVRTAARVVAISPLGEQGQLVPFVEFYDEEEGRMIQKRAQRFGSAGVRAGDEVEILYTTRKVFGLKAWNIFVAESEEAAPYRLYAIFGAIFGVIAIGLAAAGVLVRLH